MQMEVIERDRQHDLGAGLREIIFSRRFVPEAAGRSYGLHVAELAGIAPAVVGRASEILAKLSANKAEITTQTDHKTSVLSTTTATSITPEQSPHTTTPMAPAQKKYKRNRDIPEGASLFDFAPYSTDTEITSK
jgi:DNA mismatch repair ATPase MutS